MKTLLIAILFLSCTHEKDIQVSRELLTLVSIERVFRDGDPKALLHWQASDGTDYYEYNKWPCYMAIGTKYPHLVNR